MRYTKKEINKAEKRKQMLAQKRKKNMKIAFSIGAVFLICIGLFMVSTLPNTSTNDKSESKTVASEGNEIKILASEITDEATFYSYATDEGVDIGYFAVRNLDGEVRVAFDACDVCYNAKKGYRQNGDVMHCINCGLEFAISGLGTLNSGGGCWPSNLPMKIDGDYIIIETSDLEDKRFMFQ